MYDRPMRPDELNAIARAVRSGAVRPGDTVRVVRVRNPSRVERATAKALRRMREESKRSVDRADLDRLRAAIKKAKARRSRALATIRAQCKRARVALRAEQKRERQALSNRCQLRAYQAKTAGGRAVTKATTATKEMRALQRKVRGWEGKAKPPRSTARERRQESDDAVESNIPPDLVPIWRKVKRSIHGSAYRSRTEAFLEWVEENAAEVWAMREEEAAKELAKLMRQEQRARRASGSDEVPF